MVQQSPNKRESTEAMTNYHTSLLAYDYSRCGGTDSLLCKTCRRTSAGNPFRQSYVLPKPLSPEDSCEIYLPVRPEQFLQQWVFWVQE